jgi:hypothetical protein
VKEDSKFFQSLSCRWGGGRYQGGEQALTSAQTRKSTVRGKVGGRQAGKEDE